MHSSLYFPGWTNNALRLAYALSHELLMRNVDKNLGDCL